MRLYMAVHAQSDKIALLHDFPNGWRNLDDGLANFGYIPDSNFRDKSTGTPAASS